MRIPLACRFCFAAFWSVAFLATGALADDPVYFRHDHGLAADDRQTLPEELEPSAAVWRQELPPGHSTPTIVGDQIYLTAHEGNELLTICLSRKTGDELWRHGVTVEELEKTHNEGSPAAASVAADEERVFAFFGSYGLLCYDRDGQPLWRKEMGPFRDEFGSASSPVLADGKVYMSEDHDLDSFVISIDQRDGKTVWETPRPGFTRSYATPVLWNVGDRTQLVVAGSLQLMGYDPGTGDPLWTVDGFARIVNTTPVVAGDMLYVATWSPGGDTDARIGMEPWDTALSMWDGDNDGLLQKAELPAGPVQTRFFRIDLNSNQELDQAEWEKYARVFELAQNTLVALQADPAGGKPETVWEYNRGLPYVASPLVYRDMIFLVKDGGIVTALEAADGKLVKQARAKGQGSYYASPVAGDGKVFVCSSRGAVTVFRAGPKLEILSSHDFGERIFATPVITEDGRIFLRTDAALYCFSL
ncbi:MAG: pyrrolo-quinoline quinone [Planctomycetota bacterium]|nr:MAG: pyrrolo-quinoline quinone [Planctomycetota bacterium]